MQLMAHLILKGGGEETNIAPLTFAVRRGLETTQSVGESKLLSKCLHQKIVTRN